MKISQEILDKFIQDPDDKINLLNLADSYLDLNQHAMAFPYYMKCAEACNEVDYDIKYHCLMCMSTIFWEVGNRWKGAIQYTRYAKAECPDRPEAYYLQAVIKANQLYSRGIYEQDDWVEVYELSKIGALYATAYKSKGIDIPESRYYHGLQGLYGYYLISLFRLNKLIELEDALNTLELDYNNPEILSVVSYIYEQLGKPIPYVKLHHNTIKDEILNNLSSIITSNSSRCGEDIFACLITSNSSYLDITTQLDDNYSNTKSLEANGWSGIQLTPYINVSNNLTQHRFNKTYCFNEHIEYASLLHNNDLSTSLGYISFDCKGSESLSYLKALDSNIVADVISFRHDGDQAICDESRDILASRGYQLIVSNVLTESGKINHDLYINVSKYQLLPDSKKELISRFESNSIGINLFRK